MCTHTSYPVVESRGPVRSFREVVYGIVASVTRVQKQTNVLDVVLYGRLHPFCWERHDYTQKHRYLLHQRFLWIQICHIAFI